MYNFENLKKCMDDHVADERRPSVDVLVYRNHELLFRYFTGVMDVENGGELTDIYICTTNISGSTDLTGDQLMERLVFTAGGNGELVVETSNQSDTAPAYCVELP